MRPYPSVMLQVGLTGNIGSGKSTIARIFSILGIPVFHADDVSKNILFREEIKKRLVILFGPSIFNETGDIDKGALANLVFSDGNSLSKLNNLLHPLVMEEFNNWCQLQREKPYAINESAIIYEYGFQDYFDKIIHVSTPAEIAVARVVKRDGVAETAVIKRMDFQWEDEKKAAIANFIVLNDGSELVIPQVLKIHNQLLNSSTQSNDDISSR